MNLISVNYKLPSFEMVCEEKNEDQTLLSKRIENIEGFKYGKNGGSDSRWSLICSQSLYIIRNESQIKYRQRDVKYTLSCNGLIKVSYKKGSLNLMIKHDINNHTHIIYEDMSDCLIEK